MRLGSRRFAPRWWATLLYVLVALAMLALGRWQLERAAEKIVLLDNAARAQAAPAVALERVEDVEEAAREYRRVRLVGRWQGQRQFLWDNRAHGGRAGYEVITPLRLPDGRLALVNRGWVSLGTSREVLPDLSLPTRERARRVSIEGLLSRPSKGFAGGEALAAGEAWPRVLQYFDYAAIGEALGEPIVEGIVQVRIAADAASRGAVLAGAADGTGTALLTPNWRPAASGPEKHYGYAFQWFAMAAALTVIFVVVNLSRESSLASQTEERP